MPDGDAAGPRLGATLRSHGTLIALLGLLILAAYGNSLRVPFLRDDLPIVVHDPRVREVSGENLYRILSQPYWPTQVPFGLYRPITTLTYLANHAVAGGAPTGFHVVNLLLHWANAALVYLLICSLTRRRGAAFVAAALFGVHPLTTEAVTNIVGRADLLACLSVLSGLLLYVRARAADSARRRWLLAAAIGSFTLGLFAKENAVVLLGLVVLHDWLLAPPGEGTTPRPPLPWRWYLLFLPSLLLMAVVRHWVASGSYLPFTGVTANPLIEAHGWPHFLTAVKVLVKYLALMLWPARLSCDYSYNQIPLASVHDGAAWVSLALLGLLVFGGLSLRQRRPFLCFSLLFWLIAIAPVSNFPLPIGTIMGERLAYLPLVGIISGVTVGLAQLTAGPRGFRWIGGALAVTVLLTAGVRTSLRNADWRDERTLWSSTVRAAPGSYKAHLNLASALAEAGEIGAAMGEAQQAKAILATVSPEGQDISAITRIGELALLEAEWLRRQGLPESARASDTRAVQEFERAAVFEQSRRRMLLRREVARGRPADDIGEVGWPALYRGLSEGYRRLGLLDRSLAALAQLQLLIPTDAEPYLATARLETELHRPRSAAIALRQAALVAPDAAGSARAELGPPGQAGDERQTMQEACYRLVRVLVLARRRSWAVALCRSPSVIRGCDQGALQAEIAAAAAVLQRRDAEPPARQ